MFSVKSNFNAEEFEKNALEAVKKNLKEKIESVQCPVHNQTGRADIEQGSDGNINYKISGCCDALTDAVRKSLG